MEKSIIYGIMLQHTDGDKEFYKPAFTETDEKKIYNILEKYGDNNESARGDLSIIDIDAEKLNETASRFYDIMDPWERYDTTPEETAEEISKNPLEAINYLIDIIGSPTASEEPADDDLLTDLFYTIGDPWTDDETKTKEFYKNLLNEKPAELVKILLENVKMWQKLNDER